MILLQNADFAHWKRLLLNNRALKAVLLEKPCLLTLWFWYTWTSQTKGYSSIQFTYNMNYVLHYISILCPLENMIYSRKVFWDVFAYLIKLVTSLKTFMPTWTDILLSKLKFKTAFCCFWKSDIYRIFLAKSMQPAFLPIWYIQQMVTPGTRQTGTPGRSISLILLFL